VTATVPIFGAVSGTRTIKDIIANVDQTDKEPPVVSKPLK